MLSRHTGLSIDKRGGAYRQLGGVQGQHFGDAEFRDFEHFDVVKTVASQNISPPPKHLHPPKFQDPTTRTPKNHQCDSVTNFLYQGAKGAGKSQSMNDGFFKTPRRNCESRRETAVPTRRDSAGDGLGRGATVAPRLTHGSTPTKAETHIVFARKEHES